MLSSRQWSNYISGVASDRGEECCRIIAAADHCEILPGSKVILSQSALFQLFIERCDLIIFNEHRAGREETDMFDTQVQESGCRFPCNTVSVLPDMPPSAIRPTVGNTSIRKASITIRQRNTGKAPHISGETDSASNRTGFR